MRADIIAEKVIKGIHSQGWRVIGIGGSLTKAMRPLQEYIKRKVERAVKAERERAEKAEAELAALRERLAQPEQEPVAWIKCSERLPEPDKDDIAVLVEIVRGEKRSYGYYAHQKWVDLITESGGWDVGITDVTRWRPLPPLPRSE